MKAIIIRVMAWVPDDREPPVSELLVRSALEMFDHERGRRMLVAVEDVPATKAPILAHVIFGERIDGR